MSDEDRDDLLNVAANELRREDDDGDNFDGHGDRGGGKKKILLILLPILLLGGGGAGVYFSGILNPKAEKTVQAAAVVEPNRENSFYYDLPDIMVNLNSMGSKPSFIKLRASLEVAAETDKLILRNMSPRIIDKFYVYIRELRLDDFRVNGGLDRLREELRAEINKVISPVEVKKVVFRNMLVQ
ncbi:MAG: flagellar basal body-associated FliL family protein [Proteobacteria bacterium]|nr:flagellar basal body-associated FliL family protein [Pseudomonadota bacterium]